MDLDVLKSVGFLEEDEKYLPTDLEVVFHILNYYQSGKLKDDEYEMLRRLVDETLIINRGDYAGPLDLMVIIKESTTRDLISISKKMEIAMGNSLRDAIQPLKKKYVEEDVKGVEGW